MIEQAVNLAALLMSPGGLIVLLVLCLLTLSGALVYVTREFKESNTRFITFLEDYREDFNKHMDTCDKRVEQNLAQMWTLLQTIVAQLRK
jgi:hypothetical protein